MVEPRATSKAQPLVTVITIFLNAERFINEAIESVCAQEFQTWEYLLVDDGSTDASSEIARKWAALMPGRIRYLTHPGRKNRGMSASRNRGLAEACGEFVTFLDADDVWLPNKLTEQVAVMRAHPRAAMIYGRTEIWWSWTGSEADAGRDYFLDLGVPENSLVEPPKLLLLLLENKVQTPTTCSILLRRSICTDVGGFQDSFRGMFEDQAFLAKVCLRYPVYVAGQCWARYRQHPGSCCALAEAAGTANAARLPLLRWLKQYFSETNVTDQGLRDCLKRELASYKRPILPRILHKSRRWWRGRHSGRKPGPMRILVEPSDYVLRNAGDMAMLQVAVQRLSQLWPDATIDIFSDAPERMPAYAPNARPFSASGRHIWHEEAFLSKLCSTWLPARAARRLLNIPSMAKRIGPWEKKIRRRWPKLAMAILKHQLRHSGRAPHDLEQFYQAVRQADLVIANGMGGITDAFADYACELLDTLELAIHYGASTALMGQGLGPLHNKFLRERARSVLTRADFISLREERAGRPLLRELGVPIEQVVTTGDDAIEPAYAQRLKAQGSGLGVNLRLSAYAAVDAQLAERLRPLLHTAAERYQTVVVPIVISHGPYESDAETVRVLLRGVAQPCKEWQEAPHGFDDVIKRMQLCRVLVTGSYHAAVFALSLGIPAVVLANSPYYEDKFLGLADQFGCGCHMVRLHEADLGPKLADALEGAWQSAESVRPQLLEAAARQVESGKRAYRKLYEIVEAKRGGLN